MALVSRGRSILDPNAPLFIPSYHQDEEIGDDDFGFAGNDVAYFLPKNIDLDVDEDIVNMESQFEEIFQSSASEEHGIKSSLSGVNDLPKGSEALIRTLSMPKPKSPIEPPNHWWMRQCYPVIVAEKNRSQHGHFTIKEKLDVTYNGVRGCCAPFLAQFVKLGIDPPQGVFCYGLPGTGKTFLAREVANHIDAYFIRVIGSEFVQKYISEGARMVHELFQEQESMCYSRPFSKFLTSG
ncbi:26S protease regulatory subunit 7 [Capsicum baccatum]|uniref:26S protease regulatory subunit 7 n=1 Tax=Capsicum baccatum TaxID=33114 RepID=A0A2G2VFN0_CAPBA|nr:26S protease regulatory subunit 7 [Capsicum baccatum]